MKLDKYNWERVTLDDLCSIERGGSPRPIDKYFTDDIDGINWIKIGDTTEITKYLFKTRQKIKPEGAKHSRMVYEGDFILSNSMSFGRPYIMKTSGCIHDGWLLLREKRDNIDKDFLYYVLDSEIVFRQFKSLAAGTTVKNLNIEVVKKVEIPLPSIKEQKQIAELFQLVETTIENLERQEKKFKDLRKFLINNLTKENPEFGNLINELNTKEYSIGDLVDEVTDRTDNPSTSGFEKFIGLEDFESGEITIRKYSSTEKLVSAMRLCKRHDVLFARRNAYLMRVSQVDIDCVCSGDVIVLRANKNLILPMFLILVMNTKEFWDFAISNAAGTMSKRVKYRDLATYKFELPDLKTQEKILEIFKDLETTIAQIRDQKSTIENLKQKLLNEILG